jgi:hypothetical protein
MPSHGLLLLAWMLYNIVHRHISASPKDLARVGRRGVAPRAEICIAAIASWTVHPSTPSAPRRSVG